MNKYPELNPAKDEGILISRVQDFIGGYDRRTLKIVDAVGKSQSDLFGYEDDYSKIDTPFSSIREFLDFASDLSGSGGLYIFGGALRDLAMFGVKGFTSDIDIVVDDAWDLLCPALIRKKAIRNKFGGLRIYIGKMPVDIWKSEYTWAFQKGYLEYRGIHSLLETTILNWDSILMDWKKKRLICDPNYFYEIKNRRLDIVFEKNPNRIGMLVRVLRHLHQKDAKKITVRACKYLSRETAQFSYESIKDAEIKAYRSAIVEPNLYNYFRFHNFEDGFEDVSVAELINPAQFI